MSEMLSILDSRAIGDTVAYASHLDFLHSFLSGSLNRKALKKVPNFKLHSLFLNFNSCPRSISSFKSGILFWTGI